MHTLYPQHTITIAHHPLYFLTVFNFNNQIFSFNLSDMQFVFLFRLLLEVLYFILLQTAVSTCQLPTQTCYVLTEVIKILTNNLNTIIISHYVCKCVCVCFCASDSVCGFPITCLHNHTHTDTKQHTLT